MSSGWIVLGVIVVLVLFAFGAYNRLVALRQRVNQSFADIDVQLKQRHDLIPNLVERAALVRAVDLHSLDEVAHEAYPDLKANTNFQLLQTELADIENKLAAARRFFNNAVSEYNASIQSFPAM